MTAPKLGHAGMSSLHAYGLRAQGSALEPRAHAAMRGAAWHNAHTHDLTT
ncbi:hypothetical protein [Dyella silvatica]|nr:hypothetical protein [Dyella silvatica]